MSLKFYRVQRPPLQWPDGPLVHWGIAVENPQTGECQVWHSTPGIGEHWDSFADFHAGLRWVAKEIPDGTDLRQRLVRATNNPKQYDLLIGNCQQSATAVADGIPWTPDMWKVGVTLVVIFVGVGLILYKGQGGKARTGPTS